MFKFFSFLVLFSIFLDGKLFSQDTLPAISVKSREGKVIISWMNGYGSIINNINIQRSTDSLRKFSTIGTVLNPMNKENGYVDTKVPTGKIFYRVFVAFDGGSYIFSHSHQPVPDTINAEAGLPPPVVEEKKEIKTGPNVFVASKFVFTGKDNNVIISLFDAATRKFTVKFFDENDHPLFEVRVKEPYLIIEKVNFLHSGWFKYHLLDNDILLEKYKFFIPKDLKVGNGFREPRNK